MCCFNHIVGLPTKNGIEKPLFDYQKLIFDSLKDYKHLWIKKATGLGITEFMLRYMSWLCLRDDKLEDSQMCIVTGPNIDIAIKLINRLKAIFEPKLNIIFQDKETVLRLNRCTIEAFPSNHLDAYRALDNPKFIFIDEADFFRKSEQEDVRHVSERYIGKSNPYIVMVSTPNAPGGLFEKIEKEPVDTCIYKRLLLDYSFGINKIYTAAEIEEARKSPTFEREYNLQYLGKIGNLFSHESIERAFTNGMAYDPDFINKLSPKFMTLDEGFQSSNFGITIVEDVGNRIRVVYSDELNKPTYEEAIDFIFFLREKYGNILNIGFDASRPEIGRSLKRKIGEEDDWEEVQRVIKDCRKNGIHPGTMMIIVPISFSTENKLTMTYHVRKILDDPRNLVQINSKFDKLRVALNGAIFDDRGMLVKDESPYNDILDTFFMACTFFKFSSYTFY